MSAKNTTNFLKKLRGLMKNKAYVQEPLSAYIVPSGDAHQVEEPPEQSESSEKLFIK